MADPTPRTGADVLRLAATAAGKVDRLGLRGVTLCSAEEIEAMAMCLVAVGFPVLTANDAATVQDEALLGAFFDRFHPHLKGP